MVPTRVEAFDGIPIHSSSLQGHSIFICEQGKCYTCGYGGQRGGDEHGNHAWGGKLGLGPGTLCGTGKQLVPLRVTGLDEARVIQVAAGSHSSIFLTDEGKVFACGRADRGGLGIESETMSIPYGNATEYDDRYRATPTLVTSMQDERVVHVAAGACTLALVTADGDVYTSGMGCYGTLGHGTIYQIDPYLAELGILPRSEEEWEANKELPEYQYETTRVEVLNGKMM